MKSETGLAEMILAVGAIGPRINEWRELRDEATRILEDHTPSPAPQGTEAAKADLVKLASDLAQAVVDQDSDGLDRSGWILETAREFIGAKERQPAPPPAVNRELLEACKAALASIQRVNLPSQIEAVEYLKTAISSAEARHDPS